MSNADGSTDPSGEQDAEALERGETLPAGGEIPLPPGDYRAVLHFAEIRYSQGGTRVFDVFLEGIRKLDDYEPLRAGGLATADSRGFEVPVRDGFLDIEFGHENENPEISAIEVLRLEAK